MSKYAYFIACLLVLAIGGAVIATWRYSESTRAPKIQITRSEVKHVFADAEDFLAKAQLIPAIGPKNRIKGMTILSATEESLELFRLKKGDILLKINSHELSDPRVMMDLFESLKDVTHVDLKLERDGKPLTMEYEIN